MSVDDDDPPKKRTQTFPIKASLQAMLERTGVSVPQLVKLTGLTEVTVYNYHSGRREAGMHAIRKIAAALGQPWALLVDQQSSPVPVGTIDSRGVFVSEITTSGAGVGIYEVEGLDEIGAGPGDLARFVPATADDLRPGRWVSVLVDDRVQLYQVALLEGGALGLRQPSRKAVLQFVASEHEVKGRLVSVERVYD